MLQVSDLLKKYGSRTILDIKELYVNRGITHLKGINGSGKTTFSKIIAGLIPYSGNILLHSQFSPDRTKVEYRKRVNYAESEPSYPEFLTAKELIRFVGNAKGSDKFAQDQMAGYFGMQDYVNEHVGTFSSGMLKRLSLCLAFLGHPTLIILDEPFNTLDNEAIVMLIDIVERNNRNGIDFMLVSHQDITSLGVHVDSSFIVRDKSIFAS